MLIWLDKETTWLELSDDKPVRLGVLSVAAIQFCLTIKVLFKLIETAKLNTVDPHA